MTDIVIGVDPSSKRLAAVITFDGREPMLWARSLPDPAPPEVKADWACKHIRALVNQLKDAGDIYFFLEEPVVGRGGAYATIIQATIRGGILVGARQSKGVKEFHHVNNSRWKKSVLGAGHGGADKAYIKKHVRATWPKVYEKANGDQDLCDAACINAFGQKTLKLHQRIERSRRRDATS